MEREEGYEFTTFRGTDAGVVASQTKRAPLMSNEVLVSITHSGLCGTDQHYRKAGCVLGHEGIGIVQSLGPGVRTLGVGQRVGWGYVHGTCHKCRQCLEGYDQFCSSRQVYGVTNLDQGSMGYAAIWPESSLYAIPDKLASLDAAPMMCAGASIFGIYEQCGIRPNDRVGIIGLGGLGHMAVIFGAKLGLETVVFTHSVAKQVDAIVMGATEFIPLEDLPRIISARRKRRDSDSGIDDRERHSMDDGSEDDAMDIRPLDHLIVTTTENVVWSTFFELMAPRGTVHLLAGSLKDNLVVPSAALIDSGLRVFGSLVAPRSVMIRMLDFAARHRVKPIVQKFPLTAEGVNNALQKLDEGTIRYRGVLETPRDCLYKVSP
ncbi:NADP-dependent alcohol dehydrogenase [Nannizzia gypsea CBS 118893]|uniref:NADP-dependent alcohol dehydrogenase n=1 Tax=Arthroderma gypseum (strain ATCC MYA-4604 / CBS 118893) TaxID=535722 RepID=E4V703_ARTGP|nr:NADP-dependent alcohol dehydrogenase [Nannizzia gypsea CBS 118893]EFQ96869.1 NADP-dependent alcohol dehydrogenase [Nannizzia gypsea CBS 118893]